MKVEVIARVNLPTGQVEMYSDGDAVVTIRTRYGVVLADLPYAVMKPLYEQVHDDSPVLKEKPPKIPARIEKTDAGWKVHVRVGKEDRTYFYRTRDQARKAKPTNAIGGPEGRIK